MKKDFLWGVSSSAYQIEGSVLADGRGRSIWDTFCETPGKVLNGDTGAYGSDSYLRWEDDVALLHELGIGAYRFSLAWPRIQPNGTGAANHRGFAYYHRLVEALLRRDIEPWITLYHWDLPQALEDKGGWLNRDTAFHFAEYAELCYKEFGDTVKHWATLNEPWCSAFLGYGAGEHAPGKTDYLSSYSAAHHLLLAHGLAVRGCREWVAGGQVGIVLNPATPRPATRRESDRQAAMLASVERTGLWLDPLFKGCYPVDYLKAMAVSLPVLVGDMAVIRSPIDFVGVNYYNEDAVSVASAQDVPPGCPIGFQYVPTWQQKTAMKWDIVPDGLSRVLEFMCERWNIPDIYITENGAAFSDVLTPDGRIQDSERIDYLRNHLAALRRSRANGVPVNGYFVWTMLDNFEWAHGYDKRFGLVAVDRSSGERIRKNSFYFYRDVVAGFA